MLIWSERKSRGEWGGGGGKSVGKPPASSQGRADPANVRRPWRSSIHQRTFHFFFFFFFFNLSFFPFCSSLLDVPCHFVSPSTRWEKILSFRPASVSLFILGPLVSFSFLVSFIHLQRFGWGFFYWVSNEIFTNDIHWMYLLNFHVH